jgi:hypothetical protein
MPNELTNLLPADRRHSLHRDYVLRLGVVAALLASTLTVIAGVLLIPTYIFLSNSARTKEDRLATIEASLSSVSEKTLSDRLAALSADAATLTALPDAHSASAVMRTFLTIPHQGISLSSFVYTPAVGTTHGTLAVSGTATTRDTLRNYQLALQQAPFATSADLPVSAYALDTDIPFTITITLAP